MYELFLTIQQFFEKSKLEKYFKKYTGMTPRWYRLYGGAMRY